MDLRIARLPDRRMCQDSRHTDQGRIDSVDMHTKTRFIIGASSMNISIIYTHIPPPPMVVARINFFLENRTNLFIR